MPRVGYTRCLAVVEGMPAPVSLGEQERHHWGLKPKDPVGEYPQPLPLATPPRCLATELRRRGLLRGAVLSSPPGRRWKPQGLRRAPFPPEDAVGLGPSPSPGTSNAERHAGEGLGRRVPRAGPEADTNGRAARSWVLTFVLSKY